MRSAPWQEHWQALLGKLSLVDAQNGEQQLIERLSQPQTTTVLGFVNAHAMNLVASNVDYFRALSAADVLLRDGSGMAILLRRRGLEPGLNMNGTDLIPKLIAAYQDRPVAFWGTEEPFLDNARRHCEAQFGVQVVSVHHGFAEIETYVELAQQLKPALIVLGMGMPKQEQVAAKIAASGMPCLVVCGGAILDFLGGKVSRAPQWVRQLGCEWLYRLMLEPRRLFQRYVIGNPLFLLRTFSFRGTSA